MRQPLKICMEIDSYRQLLYGGSLLTKIKRYRQGFEMDVPVCIFFFHRKIHPVKEQTSGRAHIVLRTMSLRRPKRSVDCAARREEVCILRVYHDAIWQDKRNLHTQAAHARNRR